MLNALPIMLGLRYTRAKRRNQFISFISFSSMAGIALGVLALITVLSVMNGFEKEIRSRLLGMIPHATLYPFQPPLQNWQALQAEITAHPEVIAAAPFVQGQGMLSANGVTRGVSLQGIHPELEKGTSYLHQKMLVGSSADLIPGSFNVLMGRKLANHLGLTLGDKVNLLIPEATVSPAGVLPRFKRFTIAGLFEVGHQFDTGVVYVHHEDAGRLFRLGQGVTGLRLNFSELYAAPRLAKSISRDVPGAFYLTDWTLEHGNYFEAVKLEKTIMFFMLLLIIAVAAFNMVSSLVMIVNDKEREIAILRTMGASATTVMAVFIIQGALIGVVGTLIGVIAGILLAMNVTQLVAAIENTFQVQFLSSDVYFISFLPSDLHIDDVIVIASVAIVMSLIATIYPAWRATKIKPAEALRYE